MAQTVYTLLCSRDIPMALITLPNIIKFLAESQQLVIVDDGSLTEGDIKTLEQLSTHVRVVTRKEREDLVLNAISNYPNCIKFREEFAFAHKLIDIPILAKAESPRYCYTDSDIIYLHSCEAYFNRDVNTYLKTDAVKLSVKLGKVFFKYRWSIPYRFNAGYFSYDTKDYDLNLIEQFIGLPDVRNIPWLIEQTCWALLFGKSGNLYCPDENQFVCRENFQGPQKGTLAIHLIAKLKSKCQEWSDFKSDDSSYVTPIFEPSRKVTILDWVQKSFKRFIPIK